MRGFLLSGGVAWKDVTLLLEIEQCRGNEAGEAEQVLNADVGHIGDGAIGSRGLGHPHRNAKAPAICALEDVFWWRSLEDGHGQEALAIERVESIADDQPRSATGLLSEVYTLST
jgi:hypothetical protein